MIVIDTSALVAMLLEPEAEIRDTVFKRENTILISAGTVAEALIVAQTASRNR